MKLPHVLTEKATRDIVEASLWEEARSVGLGRKLLSRIEEAIEQISRLPFGYVSRHHNTREKKVKTFSYQIIYTVEENVIYIHAVFPCKQDPEKKYKNM